MPSHGQERWNKIQELKAKGKTSDEIAKYIGLKDGLAVRVWLSRNKNKYGTKKKVAKKKQGTTTRNKTKSVTKARKETQPNTTTNIKEKKVSNPAPYSYLLSQASKGEATVGAKELVEFIIEMCDIKITYLHVHKIEEDREDTRTGKGFTMGMQVDLIPKDETIFPYYIQSRVTTSAGKKFNWDIEVDEAMREYIENKVFSAMEEMKILNEVIKSTKIMKEEMLKNEKQGERKMGQDTRIKSKR